MVVRSGSLPRFQPRLNFARCDETEKTGTRYRKFNIQALLEVAVMAAGNEATSCKIHLFHFIRP